MEKIIDFILILIFIIVLGGIIAFAVIDDNKYIYECTDYKGDIVYCTDASVNRGGMFGVTEDGTKIQITSYKSILKEERKF